MPRTRPPSPANASPRGTALVTGAAKRRGAAIAMALAVDGWDVAVHYASSADEAERTVEAIRELGRRAVAIRADLRDEGETRDLIRATARDLAPPFCLVNSASRAVGDRAVDADYASLDAHLRLNLAAPIILAQTMHASLGARQRGVVVNLLDQKLFHPSPEFLSYTLSKAALRNATTLLAQALAPKLRVVGIAPASEEAIEAASTSAHQRKPCGFDDIAAAVRFLVNAQAITGSTLIVDGGQHLVPAEHDATLVAHG